MRPFTKETLEVTIPGLTEEKHGMKKMLFKTLFRLSSTRNTEIKTTCSRLQSPP